MANTIKIRRSSVAGKTPTTSDILLGELAVNTYDGKLFLKKSTSGSETGAGTSVVEIGAGGGAGVSDGDKGDITVSGSGATWTLDSISSDIPNTATGYFRLPNGTTAQRPASPSTGMVRYNTTLAAVEAYIGSAWKVVTDSSLDYGLITSASTSNLDYGALV